MREEQMDVFDAEDGEPGANFHGQRRLMHRLSGLTEESSGSGLTSQVTDSSSSLDFMDDLFMLTAGQLDFKILYIEDERVQAYFFINKCRRVFGDRCVVVHETDGIAALERLKSGEQYTVIVSDVFMSRMDGVSFFHTLFSANLNTGNLVPEGLSERELRMNIILTGADGDDISADLEQVRPQGPRAPRRSAGLGREAEARLVRDDLIELTQIVEAQLGRGAGRKGP